MQRNSVENICKPRFLGGGVMGLERVETGDFPTFEGMVGPEAHRFIFVLGPEGAYWSGQTADDDEDKSRRDACNASFAFSST